METKVAVGTGSNKGIGYAIVKGLCENKVGKVYLTARNEESGQEAVCKLKNLGFNPIFHQLDITDKQSVSKFCEHLRITHGGIDILVNNAGISLQKDSKVPFSEIAKITIDVNYFGTLEVCDSLFPLLRPNAQVVNVSSIAGHLFCIKNLALREQFKNDGLTIASLSKLMKKYVSDVKANNNLHENEMNVKGWGSIYPYVISKVGLNALSIIQQKVFDADKTGRNISVNFVHPGYVATDMTYHKGILTVEEGAKASIFLALGNHELRGQFVWHDCSVVDWYSNLSPDMWVIAPGITMGELE